MENEKIFINKNSIYRTYNIYYTITPANTDCSAKGYIQLSKHSEEKIELNPPILWARAEDAQVGFSEIAHKHIEEILNQNALAHSTDNIDNR